MGGVLGIVYRVIKTHFIHQAGKKLEINRFVGKFDLDQLIFRTNTSFALTKSVKTYNQIWSQSIFLSFCART